MKTNLALMFMFALVGCASNSSGPTVNNSREIASLAPSCRVVKHQSRDLYHIQVNGKPFNQLWYTEADAHAIKGRLEKKGMCP